MKAIEENTRSQYCNISICCKQGGERRRKTGVGEPAHDACEQLRKMLALAWATFRLAEDVEGIYADINFRRD